MYYSFVSPMILGIVLDELKAAFTFLLFIGPATSKCSRSVPRKHKLLDIQDAAHRRISACFRRVNIINICIRTLCHSDQETKPWSSFDTKSRLEALIQRPSGILTSVVSLDQCISYNTLRRLEKTSCLAETLYIYEITEYISSIH